MRQIQSLTNPTIKALRALQLRKYRRASELFLAEGMRVVLEAVALGWAPRHLVFLAGKEGDAAMQKLIAHTEAAGGACFAVSRAVLAKISRKDNPQIVVASFAERWVDLPEIVQQGGVWVGLDRVRDPGNLGTIMRSVDAAGGAGVVLIGDCVDGFSVEAVRASMGACFHVQLAEASEADFLDAMQGCRGRQGHGWQGAIIGTALDTDAVDYRHATWQTPLMLLMGNEASGLSPALADATTQLIRIPMLGRSDSLNLAVATGIALYEHLRQTQS